MSSRGRCLRVSERWLAWQGWLVWVLELRLSGGVVGRGWSVRGRTRARARSASDKAESATIGAICGKRGVSGRRAFAAAAAGWRTALTVGGRPP